MNRPQYSLQNEHPFGFEITSIFLFVQGIMNGLQDGKPLDVRVMGPVGMSHGGQKKWAKYDVIAFIVGGIGVSF